MRKISISGHRSLKHDFDDVSLVFEEILKYFKIDYVYTGMALGFDQLCAFTCLKNNVRYEACVPFEGQEDIWSKEQKEGYLELLSKADKVTLVNKGKYAKWKLMARNAHLTTVSDVLIAYLNPTEKTGGTYHCVSLVKSLNKKALINIFPFVSLLKGLKLEEEKRNLIRQNLVASFPNFAI